MKKIVKVALLIAILAAGGVGYAVSQILLERTITGTVIVASQPDLYVLGADGKAISTLAFGILTNGAHLTQTIRLANMGNTPLTINIERTDASTGILSAVKNQDDTPYDTPATIGMGQSLYLKLEIYNTVSLVAGEYPISFKVTGS